jgi:hypothetical protein
MQGSADNREYELAVVREAIAAKTDPALGADLPNAAEHLLRVLDDCEFRDARGKLRSRGNSTDLGLFFYFVWRRIMRYGFDSTQRSEARRWTFYLPAATGATGTDEPWNPAHHDLIPTRVKRHLLSIVDCDVERREGLVRNDTMNARVMLLEVKCTTSNLVARGHWPVAKTKMHLRDPVMLRRCGLPSPRSFHLELEREWAAGTERMEAERMEAERLEGAQRPREEADRMEAEG